MSKYTTKDIISVLTMSLIIANGNKDNMLHALEVAEQELEKLLEKERKDAYQHAEIVKKNDIETIIDFLKIEGHLNELGYKKAQKYARENSIFD